MSWESARTTVAAAKTATIVQGNAGVIRVLACGAGTVLTGEDPERKCAGSRHHFVQNRAEAEDVAAMIHGLAPQLLGRHVRHGADNGSVLRDRGEAFDGAIVCGRSLELGYSEI